MNAHLSGLGKSNPTSLVTQNNCIRFVLALDLIVWIYITYVNWSRPSGPWPFGDNLEGYNYVCLIVQVLYRVLVNILFSFYLLDNGAWLDEASSMLKLIPGLTFTADLVARLQRTRWSLLIIFARNVIFMAFLLASGHVRLQASPEPLLMWPWYVYACLSSGLCGYLVGISFNKYYLLAHVAIAFADQLKQELKVFPKLPYQQCVHLLYKYSNFCVLMHRINQNQKRCYATCTFFGVVVLLPVNYILFHLHLNPITKIIHGVWCATFLVIILSITKLTDRLARSVVVANDWLYYQVCIHNNKMIIREAIHRKTNIVVSRTN